MTAKHQPRLDVYQRVTDQIIAELERGTVPWLKPWDAGHGKSRVSLPLRHNGEAYHGINVLSLWMAAMDAGYTSPVWMTYWQALELGGQVRKGEKGSTVIYSGSLTVKGEDNASDDDAREIRYAKAYTVFNLAQMDGLAEHFAEPAALPVNAEQRDARLDVFFASVAARVEHGGGSAFYAPSSDIVHMPLFESFFYAASYYAVRAHETMHWTGHKTRLDRWPEGSRHGSPDYARQELVAKIGSAFLCTNLEVTPELRPDHAPYIEHWLGILKEDKRAIFAAVAHAQRTADYVLARAVAEPG